MICAKDQEKIRAGVSGRKQACANERTQVGLTIVYEPAVASRKCQSAFVLSFWVNKKERLASLSVLSRRATKQASNSLVDTEIELGGRSSRTATLAA